MKHGWIMMFMLLILLTVGANGQVYVHGYYKKDGTYVQPYYRSDPDGNPYNNWSTKGNQNPYTGEWGTKNIPPQQSPSTTTYTTPSAYTPPPIYMPVTPYYDYTPQTYYNYSSPHVSKWRRFRKSGYFGWMLVIGGLGAAIVYAGHVH